jgi:predicted enzyme related to lactoylglutathione lyase
MWFQRVPEAKSVKNRVHLDLRCADVDAEACRLVDLGARVVAVRDELTVLADPEGNEFCLIR